MRPCNCWSWALRKRSDDHRDRVSSPRVSLPVCLRVHCARQRGTTPPHPATRVACCARERAQVTATAQRGSRPRRSRFPCDAHAVSPSKRADYSLPLRDHSEAMFHDWSASGSCPGGTFGSLRDARHSFPRASNAPSTCCRAILQVLACQRRRREPTIALGWVIRSRVRSMTASRLSNQPSGLSKSRRLV